MARKKSKTALKKENENLRTIVDNNIIPINLDQKTNKYTIHDLISLKALNEAQAIMIRSYFEGNHIIADGSAGTGKTFLSMWLALNSILSKDEHQDKIILVRSAVPSREIGFLPGSAEEKLEPYELPYKDIFAHVLDKYSAYDDLKASHKVSFMPTSFIRGLTWDNAIIIIDELQNLTFHEINSILTRVGTNSRIIACGDYQQSDLNHKKYDTTGIKDFLTVAKNMKEFDIVSFTKYDIVRSDFVKSWICAMEDSNI